MGGPASSASRQSQNCAPDVLFQPIAAEDVATFVVEQALAAPINGVMEIAGPGRFTMSGMVTRFLQATGDPRNVVPNSHGTYYGGAIANATLVPAGKARLGAIDFEKWLTYLPAKQASTLS